MLKPNSEDTFFRKIVMIVVALITLILMFIWWPWQGVPAGSRGVVTTFGEVHPEVLPEGLHFIIPIRENLIVMNVQVEKATQKTEAATSDTQTATSTVVLNFHVDPPMASVLYQKVGVEYADKLVDPILQDSVKAITIRYNAQELLAKRELVCLQIRDMVAEKLKPFHILVDGFSVTDFSYSPKYMTAIEDKQTAEQMALKAKNDLQRIEVENQQKVSQAQAEAQALDLQKNAITPELLELRKVEMQSKAIDRWDGHLPSVTGGATPFINVDHK